MGSKEGEDRGGGKWEDWWIRTDDQRLTFALRYCKSFKIFGLSSGLIVKFFRNLRWLSTSRLALPWQEYPGLQHSSLLTDSLARHTKTTPTSNILTSCSQLVR